MVSTAGFSVAPWLSVVMFCPQSGCQSTEYFVCVFSLYQTVKFCTCWGQARHNPRNLINWLCHKLLPFVFNNYHRSDNVIPYGLKNAVRELKEFLVSVWVTIFTKRLSQYLDYCQCFLAMTLGDFEAFEAPT